MANLDEDSEVKSLKTNVMSPDIVDIKGPKQTDLFPDGLLPESSGGKKSTESFCRPKTTGSVLQPRFLGQFFDITMLQPFSPPPALRQVKKEDRLLSPEVKVFDHDGPSMPGAIVGPKHLYEENVKQSQCASFSGLESLLDSIVLSDSQKRCAEFAARLSPSAPPLSKTTGVITNHDVYFNRKEICGMAEQKNHHVTKGGFGTVTPVTLRNGVCIQRKRIKRCDFSKNEVTILCHIKHPNIMKLYGVLATSTHVDLLMENAGVSLMDFMRINHLDDGTIVRFSWQLISGVKELGKYKFRHCDLKPNNVCIYQDQDGSLILKIIDFGSAKLASERNDFKGLTPEYMAPELWLERLGKLNKNHQITSEKVDVWSAGLIIQYMLTGTHVFKRVGKDIIPIFHQISQMDFSKHIPVHCPKVIKDPLQNLLKKDPEERWTAVQFLDALLHHGECPELKVNTQKVPCKRKAEKQTIRSDFTDGRVHMDTLENEIMGVSCPRENMPAPVVDLHEGTVQHLPATNFEVYGKSDTVSKTRKLVISYKKARLDPEISTERSRVKVANTEGWKPTNLVVSLSQSAKVMDDTPAVWDQAGDQHAGQQGDESDLFTGDVSGVNDEEELHQPLTDDAVVDDAATDGSMVDPPDGQPNNLLPCFGELFSSMDISS